MRGMATSSIEAPGTIFIASTNDEEGGGIYHVEMDAKSGSLSAPRKVAKLEGASFLARHPARPLFYAVGRTTTAGKGEGWAHAYRIEAQTGDVTPLNGQSTVDPGPCHITVEPTGQLALVANYRNGSAVAFPISDDGSLLPSTWFVRHEGKGPNPQRQESAHVHSVTVDPAGQLAVVADLGMDKVMLYDLLVHERTLRPHAPPLVSVHPGAGPRHTCFDASGRFLYVLNELNSTVTGFARDLAAGALAEIQKTSTLPAGVAPDHKQNIAAEVRLHPSGKFLYASNRGHDSIAVFAVDSDFGKLSALQHAPAGGRTPRHFAIAPNGRFLVSVLLDSHRLAVFQIDQESGRLTQTEVTAEIPSPICVLFA